MGIVTIGMFILATILNGFSIYRSTRLNHIEQTENHISHILYQMRDNMQTYASINWLMRYWTTNSGEMELPGDVELRNKKIGRLISKYGLQEPSHVTAEQASAFTDQEQRLFAEYCYLEIAPLYHKTSTHFELDSLYCVSYAGKDSCTPIFQGVPSEELTYDNAYALGQVWPFHPDLHPAVLEMYQKREDRVYIEEVTSTVNGVKYLFAYLPFIEKDDINGYICISIQTTNIEQAIFRSIRFIEGINILLMVVSGVLLLLLLYYAVLRKLVFVQKIVRDYRDTKDSDAAIEKLKAIRSENEVGVLTNDLSDMLSEITRYTKEMLRLNTEKERISTELSLANQIQTSSLVNQFPAFPNHPEIDIYASTKPAKEVGGDFYDFFLVDDTHLGLVIGDVSGKGVPAAMIMMTAMILVKSNAALHLGPAETLSRVNDQLCEKNSEGMFVTIWFGILDMETGRIVAANAGHEYPALKRTDAPFELLHDNHRMPVGIMSGLRYEEYEITMTPGSKLFVYTDGVPEATDAQNQLFGIERMLAALNQDPADDPEKLLQNVRAGVNDFIKDAEQFDDLTMMCLAFTGPKAPGT